MEAVFSWFSQLAGDLWAFVQSVPGWAAAFWDSYALLLAEGTLASIAMVFFSTLLASLIGIPIGILAMLTQPGAPLARPSVHGVLGFIINIGRSIPFIIMLFIIGPFTRMVVGTTLGPKAATVPLIIAAVPFVARLTESALNELSEGIFEAALSAGATVRQLVFRVMLPETLPAQVRAITLTAVTLVGYSAMAGAVGGGGLGDIAVRYGYHRYEVDVLVVALILLVLLVQVIQALGNSLAQRLDKKK